MHSVHYERIPQQAKIRFVAQHCYFSLIFFAVLDSTNKYLQQYTAQVQETIGFTRDCGFHIFKILSRNAFVKYFLDLLKLFEANLKIKISLCG